MQRPPVAIVVAIEVGLAEEVKQSEAVELLALEVSPLPKKSSEVKRLSSWRCWFLAVQFRRGSGFGVVHAHKVDMLSKACKVHMLSNHARSICIQKHAG